jgi:hypothetical protein
MAIYSYLQGGLGNQMFQYAIARALSEHYQTPFALNRGWYDKPQGEATPRELDLTLLNIREIVISSDPFPNRPRKISRLLQKFLPTKNLVIYQRNAFDFDPSLFNLQKISSKNVYLSGYWQAFPYIDAIKEQLKEEFRTKSEISDNYRAYLEKIQLSESVMVHIRRGDYVYSPSAAQYHGVLPIGYYQKAIVEMIAKRPKAHFFIFSDDLAWAKEALNANIEKTFIEHSSTYDAVAQELQLMYACRHHIIANSTLSWWGAWLKQNDSGLVYAPRHWVNDANLDISALMPPEWQKIKC